MLYWYCSIILNCIIYLRENYEWLKHWHLPFIYSCKIYSWIIHNMFSIMMISYYYYRYTEVAKKCHILAYEYYFIHWNRILCCVVSSHVTNLANFVTSITAAAWTPLRFVLLDEILLNVMSCGDFLWDIFHYRLTCKNLPYLGNKCR